jgi:hypothetical protein
MSWISYPVGRFSGVHVWPVLGVPRGGAGPFACDEALTPTLGAKPAAVDGPSLIPPASHTVGLDVPSSQTYTGVVWLERVPKALSEWALWEYGGVALLAVGRWLFSRSSQPPNAANEPGMILTPKGWELDNRRLQLDNRRLNAAGRSPAVIVHRAPWQRLALQHKRTRKVRTALNERRA